MRLVQRFTIRTFLARGHHDRLYLFKKLKRKSRVLLEGCDAELLYYRYNLTLPALFLIIIVIAIVIGTRTLGERLRSYGCNSSIYRRGMHRGIQIEILRVHLLCRTINNRYGLSYISNVKWRFLAFEWTRIKWIRGFPRI